VSQNCFIIYHYRENLVNLCR